MSHILLVEDVSDIMRINRTFLENEEYTVHCADSVQTDSFMLEKCITYLVLLDVMLPDGDEWISVRSFEKNTGCDVSHSL